ncbi:hypothetical protein [Xanthomonas phage X1]|nr:hypothetical protein [Xanthomonas phage X1]
MTEQTKTKRKYTKTLKWEVNNEQFSGLTQALNRVNELLKTGASEDVRIKRIKPAITF